MDFFGDAMPLGVGVVSAIFIGVFGIIFVLARRWLRQAKDSYKDTQKYQKSVHHSTSFSADPSGKHKKEQTGKKQQRKLAEREGRRGARTERDSSKAFQHSWLLGSLKGHGGRVLDMDFAANGKYLVSCGDDDPDLGGDSTTESSSSSSFESNKENSLPTSVEGSPKVQKGLTRRQRKNRKREPKDVSPPAPEPQKKSKAKPTLSKLPPVKKAEPLEEFQKLNLPEGSFAKMIRPYSLSSESMAIWGYPSRPRKRTIISESTLYYTDAAYYFGYQKHNFDINAKEFVPKSEKSDSGRGSGSSSEEESSSSSDDIAPRFRNAAQSRVCVRCGNWFYVTKDRYVTKDPCLYHWGKFIPQGHKFGSLGYTCCKGVKDSKGCAYAKLHVWNGPAEPNINNQFVETKRPKSYPSNGDYGVYSLDCEMSYTVAGLEVTRVTLVNVDGKIAYNEYVRPKNEVVDFNTRFSGITEEDFRMNRTKTLQQVQQDLIRIISSETVLIGHGLENDLKALKIIHKTVIDTTFWFPHYRGLPFKRSLKSLVKECLKKDIQISDKGHDSYEDARACMELMVFRLRIDLEERKKLGLKTDGVCTV